MSRPEGGTQVAMAFSYRRPLGTPGTSPAVSLGAKATVELCLGA